MLLRLMFMDILFIGHSLIEFCDWQKRFPAHKVSNLGVAGETVEGLFLRVKDITGLHPSADLIFIMSGLNNVAMEDFEFLDSFKHIIESLKTAYPQARIFVNSLLPTLVEFISDKSIRDVNKSLKDIVKSTGVEFLDIYRLFIDEEGRTVKDYLLDDGVHLSNKGYAVWSEALEKIINQ